MIWLLGYQGVDDVDPAVEVKRAGEASVQSTPCKDKEEASPSTPSTSSLGQKLGSPVLHFFGLLFPLSNNQPKKGWPYYDMVTGLLRKGKGKAPAPPKGQGKGPKGSPKGAGKGPPSTPKGKGN